MKRVNWILIAAWVFNFALVAVMVWLWGQW